MDIILMFFAGFFIGLSIRRRPVVKQVTQVHLTAIEALSLMESEEQVMALKKEMAKHGIK